MECLKSISVYLHSEWHMEMQLPWLVAHPLWPKYVSSSQHPEAFNLPNEYIHYVMVLQTAVVLPSLLEAEKHTTTAKAVNKKHRAVSYITHSKETLPVDTKVFILLESSKQNVEDGWVKDIVSEVNDHLKSSGNTKKTPMSCVKPRQKSPDRPASRKASEINWRKLYSHAGL